MDVSAMYTEVFTCCHRQNHHDFLHPTKESSPSSPVPTCTVFAVVTFKLSQCLQGGDGKCRRSELCVHWFPSAFPSSFLLYFIHWSMILCAPALPEVTRSVPGCRCLGFSPSGFITEHTATFSLATQAMPGMPDNLSQKQIPGKSKWQIFLEGCLLAPSLMNMY